MEFGYIDSLECIKLNDASKVKIECEQPKQKHVTFAPYHEVHNSEINKACPNIIISSVQPISILKETNYRYSKYQELKKKIDDNLYLFLIIAFMALFEKSLRLFS